MGLNILIFMKSLPKAVNRKGAVSQAIIEILSRMPVDIPLTPAGSITFRIVLKYGTPKAKDASFNEYGISFNVSSVVLIIVGNIIILKAIPPDKADGVFIGTTTHKYAIIPITIDGRPWRTSTQSLTI